MYLNAYRARALMEEHNIDALIATTPENVTYLSGNYGWASKVYTYSINMFALFPREASAALVVPGQEMTYVAAEQSWINELYTFGGRRRPFIQPPGSSAQTAEEEIYLGMVNNDAKREKSAPAALALALRERGLHKGTLAIDPDRLRPIMRKQLQELLPNATLVEGGDLFRLIRVVKTPDEVKALRDAAELNERGCLAATTAIAAGVTERELASIYASEIGKGLGKWQWFHFGSGRRACGMFPPTNKKLEKGDMWKMDAGLALNNYQADTGWCGTVGDPTDAQLKIWEATKAGYDAALGEVKAGVLPSQIYKALVDATLEGGLPEHYANIAGHAIGLEQRELPYTLAPAAPVKSRFLPDTTDTPLEEGTTLCIENPVSIFGVGGCQIEQTIRVTKTGYEYIAKQERKFWAAN